MLGGAKTAFISSSARRYAISSVTLPFLTLRYGVTGSRTRRRRVDTPASDQADVGAFRRLDRADAAVVADVHVADFEARTLAVQAARAQGRQTPLVRQLAQRVGLVDHLAQFAAAEEEVDARWKCSWS